MPVGLLLTGVLYLLDTGLTRSYLTLDVGHLSHDRLDAGTSSTSADSLPLLLTSAHVATPFSPMAFFCRHDLYYVLTSKSLTVGAVMAPR